MTYNFALNRIKRQTSASFRKVRKGAVDRDGKPIPQKVQSWHSGKIAGLKVARSSYFAGVKQGQRKGYRSGLRASRFASRRRYSY